MERTKTQEQHRLRVTRLNAVCSLPSPPWGVGEGEDFKDPPAARPSDRPSVRLPDDVMADGGLLNRAGLRRDRIVQVRDSMCGSSDPNPGTARSWPRLLDGCRTSAVGVW